MSSRVLFITARPPYPLNDGWKIRTFNLIKGMAAKGLAVDLLTFFTASDDLTDHAELKALCGEVHYVRRKKSYAATDLLKGLVTSVPFPVLNYRETSMSLKASELLADGRYRFVQAEDAVMFQYIPERCGAKKILDMHNIESELMLRYAMNETNLFKKMYALETRRKLKKYEIMVSKNADAVFVCSEDDKKLLAAFGIAEEKIHVIPNGVDCEYFHPQEAPEMESSLVFTGTMDYHANVSGIVYFVKEVFPLIIEQMGDAKLYIVGKNPAPKVQQLAGSNIVVTGAVDDIRKYIAAAKIVVVPLLVGGGTRLKILEAMSMSKAIVSTSLGSEGIDVMAGDNIAIADDAKKFADDSVRLLRDTEARNKMGKSAFEFVRSRYDWACVTDIMSGVYENLADG